ncbi:MAG: RAMP superfamily CRISPR-associated protein [Lachnospiraceae bacterium]|jgi:CRISPR/Cas system CSM-associated protein Csm3 (group 7 of RAMP superfamily)|nr:RAMP superfamily CRISPR-associated protein [Lachnospiraceae bacterium]
MKNNWNRTYYKLEITLLSPLSIGASDSTATDKDVVLDSRGEPLIPATAVAGMFRALTPDNVADEVFGKAPKGKNDARIEAGLLFYDAQLKPDSGCHIATRDSVKLSAEKSAVEGAKFDFQAVETGAVFVAYVEARSERSEVAVAEFEKLLCKRMRLGSKNTRGYGLLELCYHKKAFSPESLTEWLDFDMFSCDKWVPLAVGDGICGKETSIMLELSQNGGLSIRQYSTKPGEPDMAPLALHDKTPVIPGTSWAGMFRGHMREWLNESELNSIFGYVDERKKSSAKSKVCFSESRLASTTPKQLTRNAIDRFTNGTKDGALYTEVTIYGGKTTLEISLDKSIENSSNAVNALLVTILDLHKGYAAIGGLTAVGRGLFRVDKVNGKPFSDDWDINTLREVIFHD